MTNQITIVHFRAYDRPSYCYFLNTSMQDIHDHLQNICNTYEPTQILTGTLNGVLPVDLLQNLKNTAHEPTT